MIERNTKQQALVMEAIKTRCDHPTADEVYNAVREVYPNIGLGTVYRVLNKFVSKGTLKKIPVPNQHDRYDITIGDHYHLFCTECKSFTDANVLYQSGINELIKAKYGDSVENHDIIFYWKCNTCLKNQNKN